MQGRVEVRRVAEQEPERVAQAAIRVRHALLERLGTDRHLVVVVHARAPQPKDLRVKILDAFGDADEVAERLRHLLAVLVHDESVDDDRLERRLSPRGQRRQQ